MERMITGVQVKDVCVDEVWSYVKCHDRWKTRKGITDETAGSKWTYIALESNSKVVLAFHVGERDEGDTIQFAEKLSNATSGELQISADGWGCYPFAFSLTLGNRVSFAQQIKTYANNDETDTRYSPRKVTAIKNRSIFGRPDMERVSTSYVERFNLELRMTARRFTRLTLSYSRKLQTTKR